MSPATNYARLSYGLKHYSDALRRYIDHRVREDWWEEYVRTSLSAEQIAILDRERRQHADDIDEAREGVLPRSGVEFLDVRQFASIFSERFRAGEQITQRMRQVQETHRRWADPPEGDYPAEEVDRALDAMHETLAYYQLPAAAEILALREGGDVPESAYARLSDEVKRHSDGMRRVFLGWAERESPAEWWEQRVAEQRRAAVERYVGDASQLTPEERIGLLGPADLTTIVLDSCDLSGRERWLLRTVFRVRRNWAYPTSGEFPDSYVAEASEWMIEALDTVADAIDDLLEPAPASADSEAATDAAAEAAPAEPARAPQRGRKVSIGDYFTCGVVIAFVGAVAIAAILVGLALLGTRTWPVDRALDASGAAAAAVGDFVDGITGTAPPEATATPVATATSTPAPGTPAATPSPTSPVTPTATPTATPTPTPTSTPTPVPEPTLSLERAIGNTDGDGVSLRDDCEDDARISLPGQGWPEGQDIEVIEVGSGRCEGWLLAQVGGDASWVREEYVVDVEQ